MKKKKAIQESLPAVDTAPHNPEKPGIPARVVSTGDVVRWYPRGSRRTWYFARVLGPSRLGFRVKLLSDGLGKPLPAKDIEDLIKRRVVNYDLEANARGEHLV